MVDDKNHGYQDLGGASVEFVMGMGKSLYSFGLVLGSDVPAISRQIQKLYRYEDGWNSIAKIGSTDAVYTGNA
ncbi:hypothetical protein D3C73_1072630 [compost metagenome]